MDRLRDLPLVIVNPASRGGAGARDWPSAAVALRAHFGAFDCRFTEGPGDASRIAENAARSGRPLVVSFGGDGTISETARGILASGTNCELGILPHGTGGDFARSLGLPRKIRDAARGLRRGPTTRVDVGRIRFQQGPWLNFINAASFGLSADVVSKVNDSNRRGDYGAAIYARATARAAMSYRHPEVAIGIDGAPPRVARITMVAFHNGRFSGGGMRMAPGAGLRDGKLLAVVVRKISLSKLARSAPLLYLGAHTGLDEVEQRAITSAAARPVEAEAEIPVEVDGEILGKLPADFKIQPQALRVRLASGKRP